MLKRVRVLNKRSETRQLAVNAINPNPPECCRYARGEMEWAGRNGWCHAARSDRASFSEPVTTSHYAFTTCHTSSASNDSIHGSIHVRFITRRMPLASAASPILLRKTRLPAKILFPPRGGEAFRHYFRTAESRNRAFAYGRGIIMTRGRYVI